MKKKSTHCEPQLCRHIEHVWCHIIHFCEFSINQRKEFAPFTPLPLVVTPQIHRAFYFLLSLEAIYFSLSPFSVTKSRTWPCFVRTNLWVWNSRNSSVSLKKVESVMFASTYERQLPTVKALWQNLAWENCHKKKNLFDLTPDFSFTTLTSLSYCCGS